MIQLARGDYLEDGSGIEIVDNGKHYEVSLAEISDLQKVCSRSTVQKITNLGNCYLTYLGMGRLIASPSSPPGLPDDGSAAGG